MAINILFHLFRSGLFSMHTGKGMRCWFILLLFNIHFLCLFVMGQSKTKQNKSLPVSFTYYYYYCGGRRYCNIDNHDYYNNVMRVSTCIYFLTGQPTSLTSSENLSS